MSALRRARLALRSDSSILQIASIVALVLTTGLTFLSAVLLSTAGFAAVTQSLIVSTITPLILAGGVPDAITFRSLRTDERERTWSSGLLTTVLLSLAAALVSFTYAVTVGLSTASAGFTALLSATAMIGMTCQGIELALGDYRRIATFTIAPAAISLLAVAFFAWTTQLNETMVIGARGASTAIPLIARVWFLRSSVGRSPSPKVMLEVLRSGLPIQLSSLLAAGSLRLEQALIMHYFSPSLLAAYGLILPAVNGIRTMLYTAGTTTAVTLARERNHSLWKCHRRLVPLMVGAGALTVLAAAAVALIGTRFTNLTMGLSGLAIFAFVAGGASTGIIDVTVRLYRASGDSKIAVFGRLGGLMVTATAGWALISSGPNTASIVSLLASGVAYAVLLAGALTNKRTRA